MQETEHLPLSKKVMYAMGQFGWSLATFSVANLVNYFYMPPETGDSGEFPILLFQGTVLLMFTVLGLANFSGRIFDAITDPIIAGLSDRSKSPHGRRRFFLMVSCLPVAILSVLVFTPPQSNPGVFNSVWVVGTILLFYLFLTMYIMPFGALLAELGHSSQERIFLSTLVSITWALGFLVGNTVYALKAGFEQIGFAPIHAFQISIGCFAFLSFICMLLPVLFIDEKRYCKPNISNEGTFQAVKSAFSNRDFLAFTLSDFCYFVSNTFLEIGIVYYVTVLMKMDEAMTTLLMTVMFFLSFAFYPLVLKLARKVGKKALLMTAFCIQVVIYAMIPLIGRIPFISGEVWGWTIILIEAIPVAIFGIVPTAIIADIARSDGIRMGNHKEAMFFGARSFMMKLSISVTNLLFPSLLLLGKGIGNDLGIRLTAVVALVFTLIGTIFLRFYNEENTNRYLAEEEERIGLKSTDD